MKAKKISVRTRNLETRLIDSYNFTLGLLILLRILEVVNSVETGGPWAPRLRWPSSPKNPYKSVVSETDVFLAARRHLE